MCPILSYQNIATLTPVYLFLESRGAKLGKIQGGVADLTKGGYKKF